MGAYYFATLVGVTNSVFTITHSLGWTPASMIARMILHQATCTATAPLCVHTIGTNIITVSSGVATLMTCDVEVQLVHSIIS